MEERETFTRVRELHGGSWQGAFRVAGRDVTERSRVQEASESEPQEKGSEAEDSRAYRFGPESLAAQFFYRQKNAQECSSDLELGKYLFIRQRLRGLWNDLITHDVYLLSPFSRRQR